MTNTTVTPDDTAIIPYPPSRSKIQAQRCSLLKSLYIEPGNVSDYQGLSHHHYRQSAPGPIAGIWAVRRRITSPYIQDEPAAVIVYTYPSPNLAVRNLATRKFFCRRNRAEGLGLLNRHVRRISRVIVDPRWRGLGLASWLVRATMPVMDVAMIESMAVMGRFHPFLEKAAMRPYAPPQDPAAQTLTALLESLNMGRDLWHDPDAVQLRMDCLFEKEARRLDRAVRAFLGRFGKRRKMLWSIERTTFVLEHLTQQWTYFAWLNPKHRVDGLYLIRRGGPACPPAICANIDNRQLLTEAAHVA
jgi:GNAT superfamily N-acetyltransferase